MTHILITFPDDILWLWWFDREGPIQSHGLNFISDFHIFVALLAILQRFDLKHWGRDTLFVPGAKQRPDNHRMLLRFSSNGEPSSSTDMIITVDSLSGSSRIAPFKYPPETSDSGETWTEFVTEISFRHEARLSKVQLSARWGLTQLMAHLYEKDVMSGIGPVCGHLPTVQQTQRTFSADLIEKVLGIRRTESKKQYRMVRVFAYHRLSSITELSGLDFVKAMRDSHLCA